MTSSTSLFTAAPQQTPPFHVRNWSSPLPEPMPSGYTTRKWFASAIPSKLLCRSNWRPLPVPPCSATSSGTGASSGSDAGTYKCAVRVRPSGVVVMISRVVPDATTAGATVAVVALAAALVVGAVVTDAFGAGASFEAHALETRVAASTPATIPGRSRATAALNLVTAKHRRRS